jgi:hypothetical protein
MPHGFLIAADLENASGLDQVTLTKGVEGIRGWYQEFWEQRQGALFSPFIDGALIAIPMDELEQETTVYRKIIESCEKWIQSVGEKDPLLSLRVAIHQGNFFSVMKGNPWEVIVGPDALHSSRLVRLASGGQVIISEEYCIHWKQYHARSYNEFVAQQRLHPSQDRPLLFWQKPNTPSQIRYVVPSEKEHTPSKAERKAALSIRTALSLMKELQFDLAIYLQAEKEALLRASGKAIDEDVIEPEKKFFGRISIFRPDPGNPDNLKCWLRLGRELNENNDMDTIPVEIAELMHMEFPTATVYTSDPPVGPVGFAFSTNEWKAQRVLPRWDGNNGRQKYHKMMEKWGFTEDMTDNMNHKSRAIFAIPFSDDDISTYSTGNDSAVVGAKTTRASGVICVDWDDPLKFLVGNEVLDEFFSDNSIYRFSLFAACAMRDES